MYKKVSSDMNFVDREKETVKFWKENEIFEKSIEEKMCIRDSYIRRWIFRRRIRRKDCTILWEF